MAEQAHVLIVEDNALDRALLDAHLSCDGFDTEFAGDGVEAWSMLEVIATVPFIQPAVAAGGAA
jgi:CheY-like chemotaxis protein